MKKGSAKANIVLILIAIFVLGGGILYSYSLFMNNQELNSEIDANRETVLKYDENTALIDTEVTRCEMLIASGTSVFGDFAYCERFLEWAEVLK